MSTTPFASQLLPATVAVESSSLNSVAYDHLRAILQVQFRDGSIYHYSGVPKQIFLDLLRDNSKGAYFTHHIRSLFPHALLRAATPARRDGSDPSDGDPG